MGQIERITSRGQAFPLVFMQSDVAASQTNAVLTVAEVRDAVAAADDQNAADGYVLPFDFNIIGISIRSSAARTAGTLTVEALINGNATGLTAVLDATNTQQHHKKQPRDSDFGQAGARIGARITTDASWAPVTADVVVTVWVLAYLDGI